MNNSQLLHHINEVSAKLGSTPGRPSDLDATLHHIVKTAQEAFHADACVIIAFNPITGKYTGSQSIIAGKSREYELSYEKSGSNGMAQQILQDGIVFIEDLDKEASHHNRFTRKQHIHSVAGLALRTRHRQKPLGVIYLDFKEPQRFSSIDRERFQIYAVQASLLLQETWLARHYEEVARIGQEINHNLSTIDDLFQILQTYVDTVLDESHTFLLSIYQPQTNMQEVYLRAQGKITFQQASLQGACEYIIRTQQPYFIRQFSSEADHLPFQIINVTGTEEKESFIFTPLMLLGSSLGVLSIQHAWPQAYGQEDQFVLQLFASYIALALHNMRLYSNLNQLNATGQLLTQLLESEHTLQAIVDQILHVTQADTVVLYPYEPLSGRFTVVPYVSGTLLDSNPQSMLPQGLDDVAHLMLSREKPIFAKKSASLYKELQGDIRIRQRDFQKREHIHSTAALSLRVGEDIVGVLFVNFRQQQRFDATQKLLIEGLAHYAAVAMKNAQIFGTLSLRRVKELTILQRIDRELSRTLDLKVVLNNLLCLALEHVPTDESSILLHNTQTHILETAAAIGRHAEASLTQNISLQQARGITRWVVENKKSVRVDNVHQDHPWRDLYLPVAGDIISELDVPLLDGDEVVGVLNFESTREAAFRREDEEFLVTLSGQAVLAIKNAQAYEREKRFLVEARVLNEISKELISQLDTPHIFAVILDKALELTQSIVGNLMIYDPEHNDLWMAAERGMAPEKKGQRQSLEDGVVGQVARTKQLLNIDLHQPPWKRIYVSFISDMRSELAVPMLAGNELRGVLNIESLLPHAFSERDERLVIALADLAVVALQNAHAYEREKRLAEESQVLNSVSKEITSQLDLNRVFDLILDRALELTRSNLCSLMLYSPDKNDLWIAAERGVSDDKKNTRQKLGQGIVGHVAETKQLLNVDPTQDAWQKIYLEFSPDVRSELAVPMLAGNELQGVLNVESLLPHNFSERDEHLLQGLADLAVVALQNAERYKKAERNAQRFELLYKAGQELSKITDLEQIEQAYETVVEIAATQSQSQALIYRYDETSAELVLSCSSSYQYHPLIRSIARGEGLNGQVAREKKTLVIEDKNHLPVGMSVVKQSDPEIHSFLVTPIMFKDQYYGNLDLRHEEVGHFRATDRLFFEGLAQQLANTIHRLETVKAHLESEKRARASEEMSSVGQSAYEVTHRLGNDLGLVESYVEDIHTEMHNLDISSAFIDKKLANILQSVQMVLSFSRDLKEELAKLGDHDEATGEPVILAPGELLQRVVRASTSSPTIEVCLDIEKDVASISVFPESVTDILENLITNAMQAMPHGGKLTLRAHNDGRSVALEVSDTGIGIPDTMQSNIFDLFFSTKGSSGFGLWSARRNALRNHGDLKVRSSAGEGTTFTLLLPRANETLL